MPTPGYGEAMSGRAALVLYDADCGICTRLAAWLAERSIRVSPIRSVVGDRELRDLTRRERDAAVHVVHDCGRLVNPAIVEGQIQGGVAHGIGNAFYEQLVFDDQGQLLTASLMDYLLPVATDVPDVEIVHRETPAPGNPGGLKGVGEAGCIATGAAFAQAVEDALGGIVEIREIPLSPNRLFELLQAAHAGEAS